MQQQKQCCWCHGKKTTNATATKSKKNNTAAKNEQCRSKKTKRKTPWQQQHSRCHGKKNNATNVAATKTATQTCGAEAESQRRASNNLGVCPDAVDHSFPRSRLAKNRYRRSPHMAMKGNKKFHVCVINKIIHSEHRASSICVYLCKSMSIHAYLCSFW